MLLAWAGGGAVPWICPPQLLCVMHSPADAASHGTLVTVCCCALPVTRVLTGVSYLDAKRSDMSNMNSNITLLVIMDFVDSNIV